MTTGSLSKRFLWSLTVPVVCGVLAQGVVSAQSRPETRPGNYLETLALARAKTNAKEWNDAAGLWERVVQENPVEVRFWSQLANAHYNAKNYRKAIPAYQKVVELRGGFPSDAAYNIACCYALLGEKEPALRWLEQAFEMGYRNPAHPRTDTDLQSLRDDPRFQRLIGLADVTRMSRDEGWRYDLALLAREVKRKGYAYGVYRQLPKSDFDAAVGRLNQQIPTLTDSQIFIELMKLLKSLGDGHTGVLGPPPSPEYALALPLQFYFFKEGLFIIASDPKYKELLGAQVLGIGTHTVDEVNKALDQIISRDNEIWPSQVAPYRMRSLALLKALGLNQETSKISLTISDANGTERAVTVECDSNYPDIWNDFPSTWVTYPQTLGTPLPLYLKNRGANYWFEYVAESKTIYFQYNRIRNDQKESLAIFSTRLFKFINDNEVDKLVIDMRRNNGGNTFLSQPLLYGLIRSEKINQRGKLFVIIGRRTFSAAQNTATFFERHTNAIFVGEPTGSGPNFVGEETPFTLPYSKILINISDLYWQSSWPQDYRTWIAPLIYTPPTFAAYRANRDLAMEAIVGYK